MLRGIWGDPERYRDTYWSRFDGKYFAGDGAKRDDEGYFWLLGRVDDIMLVVGHNISTTEVESALVDHPAVAEAAVVGRNRRDDRSGDRRVRHPARRHRAARRARRGAARPRRRAHRPDREAEVDPLHRGAAEDALGQDHAPAAAQRRGGRGARRHDDARRSRRSSTASRRATSPPHPRRSDREHGRGGRRRGCDSCPNTGPGATSRSCPARAVVVDIDGVLSDASTPPALHRVAAPGLARVLRRVRRGPGDRRGAHAARPALTRAPDRAAHRPPAPGAPPHRGVAPALRDPLGPADHAAVGRLRAGAATSSSRRCGSCARPASTCGLAFEDDRRNVEMFRAEGIPCLYVHSGYYD